MFGGLAFLVRGNMAIVASGQGGAMVRVDPAQSDELIATTHARLVEMLGRQMPGWLRIDSARLGSEPELARWVELGTRYARSLPRDGGGPRNRAGSRPPGRWLPAGQRGPGCPRRVRQPPPCRGPVQRRRRPPGAPVFLGQR